MVSPRTSPGQYLEFENKRSRSFLIGELFLLFILTPLLLVADVSIWIKVSIVLLEFVYAVITVVRGRYISQRGLFHFSSQGICKVFLIRFSFVVICSTGFIYSVDPELLFIVVRKSPGMWVGVSLFYSFISVLPQEFVFRSFFFTRYQNLFGNPYSLILTNAVLFSFAHFGFKSPFVLLIAFIGGAFFALTYYKTKSLLLTSLEHAIYGSWLFTVGMGGMLAFPMPS